MKIDEKKVVAAVTTILIIAMAPFKMVAGAVPGGREITKITNMIVIILVKLATKITVYVINRAVVATGEGR